jgi:beta-lactamase regulating signal transducer with metallopeptidase domain
VTGFEETIRMLAWALIHFLWQGALIAMALEVVLAAMRRSSAEARYAVRCGALVLMGLAPAITFQVLRTAEEPPAEVLMRVLAADPAAATVISHVDPWLSVAVGAWALVVGVLWTRLLRDYLRIRKLQKSGAGEDLPAFWQARFDRLADAMGVRAVARVVDSAKLAAPTVIGWMRPVVLMPARVLTGLSQEQVEALIAHELAHVRRHDFAVNLVQSVVESLLFYHPAVWWVSKGIRTEREYCCDDAALRATTDRMAYARALTTLESWRGAGFPNDPALQAGMSTLGGSFMQRIQRMVGVRPSKRSGRGPRAVLGALVVLTVLGATAFGHTLPSALAAQDPETLREIRARIAELESRLSELKSLLHRAEREGDAVEVIDVEPRADAVFEVEVDAHHDGDHGIRHHADHADHDAHHEDHAEAHGDVRVIEIPGGKDGDGVGKVILFQGKNGMEGKVEVMVDGAIEIDGKTIRLGDVLHAVDGDGGIVIGGRNGHEHGHDDDHDHGHGHGSWRDDRGDLHGRLKDALHGAHLKLRGLFGHGDDEEQVEVIVVTGDNEDTGADAHGDVRVELRGIPNADKIEKHVRKAIERAISRGGRDHGLRKGLIWTDRDDDHDGGKRRRVELKQLGDGGNVFFLGGDGEEGVLRLHHDDGLELHLEGLHEHLREALHGEKLHEHLRDVLHDVEIRTDGKKLDLELENLHEVIREALHREKERRHDKEKDKSDKKRLKRREHASADERELI